MANFNRDAPSWDVRYKNNAQNRNRLKRAQTAAGGMGTIYFSDYKETGKWMKNDRKLRKVLGREARSLRNQLKSAVPRGEGTGGHHVEDALKMRYLKHGGVYGDRMAYHVYVIGTGEGGKTVGDSFLNAERASQFSKDAWKTRMAGGKVRPNRKGWVEQALNRSSIGVEGTRRKTASARQRWEKGKKERPKWQR